MEGEIYCAMCVCLIGCIQGADCSGRTLATLMVAWIATLMVTSILLKWQYTWIVVTILTILFLLICAGIAYNIKKAHLRSWLNEHQRTENERERRDRRNIWTISGITVDNRREAESHRVVDLPPSYSSVVLSPQSTSESSRPPLTTNNSSDDLKCEDPPPYSCVISLTDTCDRSAEATSEPNIIPSAPAKNDIVSVNVARIQGAHTTDD